MFRQDDGSEMLLPNAQVSLLARSGPVDSRTTDGISEPWCFNDLEPGNYIVRHTALPGYVLSDGGQWNFTLDAGEVRVLSSLTPARPLRRPKSLHLEQIMQRSSLPSRNRKTTRAA